MKNRKVAAYLGIALFAIAAAGCESQSGNPSVPTVEREDTEFFGREDGEADVKDNTSEDEKAEGENRSGGREASDGMDSSGAGGASDGMNSSEDGGAPDAHGEQEVLPGSISSINGDSLVVSRAFEEGELMVAPAEGSADEELVTVSVSEDTQYEVKTVKNGGVHESDVETRAGGFSDLEEDASVDILGYFDGEVFVAEKITVYRFV